MLTLTVIAIIVVAAIAVVLILAASKPDVCRVERAVTIKADAAKVFPYINDFHNWASWSPFEKLDRNMSKTFSGEASGKGAIFEWTGNKKAGAGRMEIVESSPPRKVRIQLNFFKPFKAQNTAEFTMVPKGDSTEVTWAMYGPAPFVAKIMHVFMNMDKMIGKDFDEGLYNLKSLAET